MEKGVNKYLHSVLCPAMNQEQQPLVNKDSANAGGRSSCGKVCTVAGIILISSAALTALSLGIAALGGVQPYTQYVRWGSKDCPHVSGTTLLYSGYTAGHNNTGGGANYMCLPYLEELIDYKDDDFYGTTPVIFTVGTEYHTFVKSKNYLDAACAVCTASRSQVVMIPASDRCVGSWTKEYDGYLMTDNSSSTIECVDTKMDSYRGTADNRPELAHFSHVVADNKAELPNYYRRDKVLRCVVCTK